MDYYEPRAKEWERDLREIRLRLLGAGALLVAVMLVGTVGFRIIEPDASWVRAFYMTAISLTTVGYGEEIPVDTDAARIFTAGLILVGMGGVLYFVSSVTAFILEGHLGHVFRRRRMERDISTLDGHVIVCGAGASALYAARELSTVGQPVVLVVDDADVATGARAELDRLADTFIVVGSPTNEGTLVAAGVERAAGLVASTGSDNENVVVTLTARQVNPSVRIVSRVQDVSHEQKIRKAGADAVVSPDYIGGLRMASELIRPTVVSFLDTMLRDAESALRVDEIGVPAGSPSVGKRLNELGLETMPEVLLVAVRLPDGSWQYNPPRSREVLAGMVLVVLGSSDDAHALCRHVGGEMFGAPSGSGSA